MGAVPEERRLELGTQVMGLCLCPDWALPSYFLQAVVLGTPGVMATPTTVPASEAMPTGGRRLQQVG